MKEESDLETRFQDLFGSSLAMRAALRALIVTHPNPDAARRAVATAAEEVRQILTVPSRVKPFATAEVSGAFDRTIGILLE